MKRGAWTDAEEGLLRERYPSAPAARIAEALGRPVTAVYARANALGLKKSEAFNASPESGRIAKGEHKGPGKAWAHDEIEALKRRYPDEATAAIARDMGRAPVGVYAMAKKLGLVKSDAFRASEASGRITKGSSKGAATRFQKGNEPWTKGKKGVTKGGKATQFKKGAAPHNRLPVGAEVVASIGYLKTKIAEPNHWEFTHVLNWIAAHGPVPEGHMLRFRDGNRLNPAVENLFLVSREEHMANVTIHRYPPEIRDLIRLQGRVRRAIERKADEKQD